MSPLAHEPLLYFVSLFCWLLKSTWRNKIPRVCNSWYYSWFFCSLSLIWFTSCTTGKLKHTISMMWRLCWFMHNYVQPVTVLKQSVASFSKLNRPLLQYIKSLKKKKQKISKVPSCRAKSGCLFSSRIARLSTMFSCLGKYRCGDISPWIKIM